MLLKPLHVLSIVLMLLFISACSGSPPPARLEATATPVQTDNSPYDVASRPLPGSEIDQLLPSTVGPFTRTEYMDYRPESQELVATYRSSEGELVFVSVILSGNIADAQTALAAVRANTIAEGVDITNERYVTGQPTSYFKVDQFMAWSRGNTVINANASSPEALDAFMMAIGY